MQVAEGGRGGAAVTGRERAAQAARVARDPGVGLAECGIRVNAREGEGALRYGCRARGGPGVVELEPVPGAGRRSGES